MRPTVILSHCDSYDSRRIRRLIREGLDTLDLRPRGRTLVKPNVVASGPEFPHAYTRPEFIEGVLLALKDRGKRIRELAVGERCGITMPTRYAFRHADYYPMAQRVGDVRLFHFDELSQVEIPLSHPERLRPGLFVPEPVARADFFVNCPKFKAHPWTTVTFSMKNYIGIQDDRHRLLDHDHALNRKIADLQYVLQPQFIAIDAIVAGEGR
ncbi:MAG: FeS-binding protein, partial [Gemmatimonadetes bacterium]|nr:FeS-binding protein [Gemmatimonadota bacterium]